MRRLVLTTFLTLAASAALAQSPAERGSYLVNTIGACSNCHTPRLPPPAGEPNLELRLSGGFQTFNEPFFTVKGSNLTPDRDTGLGSWSDAEIKRALTEGLRPNGVPLAMVMPYGFIRVLTARDLDAVVAYLRTLPPIRNEVQTPVYKIAMASPSLPGAEKPMTEDELKDPVKHGFYLASLAHCMACHSRTSEALPADFKNAWGKGGRVFKGPFGESVAANISGHKEKGLGGWTDAEIKRALTQGTSKDGRRLKPPMIDYVAFSNRPFGVKHFQAIHQCSVDVAHGLALLFGIGTKAVPPWDSRTRRNNLLGGLAVS
jgi:mono/diheme cytochrome c family protein